MSKKIVNKPAILLTTSTFPTTQEDSNTPSFILDLAISLTANWTVIVLAPYQKGAKIEDTVSGVKVYRYRYMFRPWENLVGQGGIYPKIKQNWLYTLVVPFFLLFQFLATIKIIKKEKVKLIHAHWLFPQGFIARLVNIITKIPYGVSSHGSDISQLQAQIFQLVHRFTISKAKFFTTVSQYLADKIQVPSKLPKQIIPMGIKPEYFSVKRQNINPKYIISVGRLDKQKGFQDIIKAMLQLPDYHYTIIGEGVYRQHLDNLIQQYQVTHQVTLLGSQNSKQIIQAYQTAGIYIHPAYNEGLGLTVIEAMAAKVPVIVNDIPILQQHIQQGSGLAINTKDSQELQQAIQQISSIDLAKAQQYAQQFQWASVAQQFSQIYKDTLGL
jgi:glycosyltransferase involved in cell wall biosynthesis